jgi:hypothetical protein
MSTPTSTCRTHAGVAGSRNAGPGSVNDLLRDALYPYPNGLAIVSKVAVRRDDCGVVLPFDDSHQPRKASKTTFAACGSGR